MLGDGTQAICGAGIILLGSAFVKILSKLTQLFRAEGVDLQAKIDCTAHYFELTGSDLAALGDHFGNGTVYCLPRIIEFWIVHAAQARVAGMVADLCRRELIALRIESFDTGGVVLGLYVTVQIFRTPIMRHRSPQRETWPRTTPYIFTLTDKSKDAP